MHKLGNLYVLESLTEQPVINPKLEFFLNTLFILNAIFVVGDAEIRKKGKFHLFLSSIIHGKPWSGSIAGDRNIFIDNNERTIISDETFNKLTDKGNFTLVNIPNFGMYNIKANKWNKLKKEKEPIPERLNFRR